MIKVFKALLLASVGMGCGITATAQSKFNTVLSNGAQTYKQLYELVTQAEPGKMSASDIANLELWRQMVKVQMDSAMVFAADSERQVVRYFYMMNDLYYSKGLQKKGDKQAAFVVMQFLDTILNGFSNDYFPLEYATGTLFHIVRRSDFEPVLCTFNADLGIAYYNNNQLDTAIVYLRRANDPVCLEPEVYTMLNHVILQIKMAKKEEDTEMLDAAVALFSSWNSLDEIARGGLPTLLNTPTASADAVEKILIADPALSAEGEVWARTSRLLTDEKLEERAVSFAVNGIKNGYTDKEFLLSLFPQAQNVGNKLAARLAADEYAALTNAEDCEEMQISANHYELLEEKELAAQYKQKAEKCQKHQIQTTRNAAKDAGIYIGAYVSPLFRSDWGAVGAIQTRKWMLEASYQALDDRRDKLYDLRIRGVDGAADERVRWDGYYSHLAISKLSGKKGGHSYSGVLFGYNLREYQPVVVNEITNASGDLVNSTGAVTFNPKEERYIFMLNSGRHSYGRILASDIFFGIGGSWTTFKRGNDQFDNEEYTYSHSLIDSRKKGRISLMARFGVTIGLQVGHKTFEKKVKKKVTS